METPNSNHSMQPGQTAIVPHQRFLDALPDGVICYQAVRIGGTITDCRTVFVNQAARQINRQHELTIQAGERLMADYSHKPGLNLITNYISGLQRTVLDTGQPISDTRWIERLTKWYSFRLIPLGDDLIMVIYHDATQEVEAKQQQDQQRQLQQSILDASLNGIIAYQAIRDDTGKVVDLRFRQYNEMTRQYLNLPPDVLKCTMLELFPGPTERGVMSKYVRVIETGEPTRYKIDYNDDGLNACFDVSVVKMDDGIVLTFQDISAEVERSRQIEEQARQLAASVAELQKSNENLEQFAYITSHDLQEPLRKINAFANVVMDQYAPQLGKAGRDMIRRMQVAATRMQVLIDDLLLFSRLGTKKTPFSLIDLNALLADVLLDLDEVIRRKKAVVEARNLFTIPGDASQLRQLLLNLLSNALKFTLPNSPPVVAITCQQLTLEAVQQWLPAANHVAGYFARQRYWVRSAVRGPDHADVPAAAWTG